MRREGRAGRSTNRVYRSGVHATVLSLLYSQSQCKDMAEKLVTHDHSIRYVTCLLIWWQRGSAQPKKATPRGSMQLIKELSLPQS